MDAVVAGDDWLRTLPIGPTGLEQPQTQPRTKTLIGPVRPEQTRPAVFGPLPFEAPAVRRTPLKRPARRWAGVDAVFAVFAALPAAEPLGAVEPGDSGASDLLEGLHEERLARRFGERADEVLRQLAGHGAGRS